MRSPLVMDDPGRRPSDVPPVPSTPIPGPVPGSPAAPFRVLVVDDDPETARRVHLALDLVEGCEVVTIAEPRRAVATIRGLHPHVLVVGVRMGDVSGFDIVAGLARQRRGMRIVLLTPQLSTDEALAALRVRADEILAKPVDVGRLVGIVRRLADDAARSRTERAGRTVLAIGAHPDDVEIGVGATLVAHRAAGDSIVVLTLSRGARGGAAESRQHESMAAAEQLGARLFLEDLTDAHLDTDSAVGIIERVVAEVGPAIVYTHTEHERHQDHRAVHAASMVATRRVPFVGCYQSPSTTVDFRPNRFVVVDDQMEAKLELLRCYASQAMIRTYLEPDFVLSTARYWSRFGTGTSAEPLEIVRDAATVAMPTSVVASGGSPTISHDATVVPTGGEW